MQIVCQLINSQENRTALVRLWHLAKQATPGGGTLLDQWSQRPFDDLAQQRIRQHFNKRKNPLCLQDLESRPTKVIEELDRLIATPRGKKPAFTPIEVEGVAYFLIQGSPHNGVDRRQAVRFGNYMRNHQVVPAKLLHNVSACIRTLAEQAPFSHKHLTKRLREHEPVLRVALGHFPDFHQISWSTVKTDENRQIGFATGTEGENNRFAQAQEQILAAEKSGADLLIFPELTLAESVQEKIRDWLLQRDEQNDACSISLIVLGSFHVRSETYARNRCRLLQGKNGRNILTHDKFSPASIGGFTEGFTPGESASLLCTPIGNLSLAICKDCIGEYWDIWLKQLCPDWLIIPSLSDGITLHQQATRSLWNLHRSTSLVANQPIDNTIQTATSSAGSPHFGYVHTSHSQRNDKLDATAFHPGTPPLWILEIAIPAYKTKQC
ncbi:hypothetical protein [Azonexus sp.]|uniref:hypothetical protein n=1 Tax=Azonexus sp. TaxID=1872668 RepID=UPI0035B237DE